MDIVILSEEQVLKLIEVVGLVTSSTVGQERHLADFDAANFVMSLF